MKSGGLARQLTVSMVSATMLTTVLATGFWWGTYFVLVRMGVEPACSEETVSSLDLTIMAFSCLGAGAVGLIYGLRVARRIIQPIVSVAENARQIATGDLTARASAIDDVRSELALMVNDFNIMAQTIERNSRETTTWHAIIAHELRTPVTVLKGRVQGLADGVFQPSNELYANLLKHIEGLTRLIEDLRTLSLADSGRLACVFAETDVPAEVTSVVVSVEKQLRDAGFTVELDAQPVRAVVDAARVRQAVLALLENVGKHAGGGIVRVSTSVGDGRVVVRVADSGPGLPRDFVTKAFEPFSSARRASSADAPTSGLGLAVVSAIATAHGGSIRYDDTDPGAAFTLTMPLTRL